MKSASVSERRILRSKPRLRVRKLLLPKKKIPRREERAPPLQKKSLKCLCLHPTKSQL
jgi:hypothetical protein